MRVATMNVLVTGCAGFIGRKVTEFLLKDGHTVVGVDNLNDAYNVRLKEWRLLQNEGRDGFSFHRLDITDRVALSELFARGLKRPNERIDGAGAIDAVVNLAARAGVRQSIENPKLYYEANVDGTLNLLELCREYAIHKFVLASTSSLYGSDNPRPFREDANTDRPLSPYAASKKAAEALCYSYHHLYAIDVTILRFFTVYGPAGRPDMSVFRFIEWIAEGVPLIIYGDGSQERDFTYVDDIARGAVAALQPVGFDVINLGGDNPVALIEVISRLEEQIGRRAQLVYQAPHATDIHATWADISRAREILDWSPRVALDEGLRNSVEWYRSHALALREPKG